MPHGWAIAEMWLLLRDCLVYEGEDRLHLLPGVPPEWFTGDQAMAVENLPTYFGICSFAYMPDGNDAMLTFHGRRFTTRRFCPRIACVFECKGHGQRYAASSHS